METNKRKRILYSREDINTRVKALGEIISNNYKDKNLLVISLLRGSFVFASDLVREISIPVEVDFMTTESYGHDEVSSGNVEIVHDIRTKVEGKDILIVDDIIDSGYTMEKVIEFTNMKEPKSIKICEIGRASCRERV